MSNMSYCRFQNTLDDLKDCDEHFGDRDLSLEEIKARNKMLKLCEKIANDYYEMEEKETFEEDEEVSEGEALHQAGVGEG